MTKRAEKIWIVTADEAAESQNEIGARSGVDVGGGFGDRIGASIMRRVGVNADALKAQMAELLSGLGHVFEHSDDIAGVQLEAVELAVEINSEGQVSIIGTGVKLGGRGAIKLTFKRRDTLPRT
jgi:hypothetical protein